MEKFKVGDLVRTIESDDPMFKIGARGKIIKVRPNEVFVKFTDGPVYLLNGLCECYTEPHRLIKID